MEHLNRLKTYAADVETALDRFLPAVEHSRIHAAMRYSILTPGKRIRPALTLEFARVCGTDPKSAMPFACALEMIHCYSLIHDDLPCMDNDDFRRGKPTNHKVFGEDFAVLAGDGLLTHAFVTASKAEGIAPESKLAAIAKLAELAGLDGMLGGQAVDVETDGKLESLDALLAMYAKKTGALIRCAGFLGCAAADASSEQFAAADRYTAAVGLAFQIRDDLLDIEQDKREQRLTYATIEGEEKSVRRIVELSEEASAAADTFEDSAFLKWLASYLAGRTV